jgi:glycerophosphoryl diester phosphodiesterase
VSSPEVIAHRGAPRELPENTLPSFQRALDLGAAGIELDVHATRDDRVVVHHDPDVLLPGALGRQPIRSLSFGELAGAGQPGGVPLLDEVLRLVAGRARLYVEIKGIGIETLVVASLEDHFEWCAVHSFDHRIVRRCAELAPSLARGVLMTSYLVDPLAPLRDTPALDLWQHWSMIDGDLVSLVHRHGGRVIAWTVNETAVADRLADWGVDGICTDLPGAFARNRIG